MFHIVPTNLPLQVSRMRSVRDTLQVVSYLLSSIRPSSLQHFAPFGHQFADRRSTTPRTVIASLRCFVALSTIAAMLAAHLSSIANRLSDQGRTMSRPFAAPKSSFSTPSIISPTNAVEGLSCAFVGGSLPLPVAIEAESRSTLRDPSPERRAPSRPVPSAGFSPTFALRLRHLRVSQLISTTC